MEESGPTAKPTLVIDVDVVPLLYATCLRCTYRHLTGAEVQTRPVDEALAAFKRSPAIVDSFARGAWIELHAGERFKIIGLDMPVESLPDDFPAARVVYRGTIDALVEGSDGRISVVKLVPAYQERHPVRRYERELAALSYALERPAVEPERAVRVKGHALVGFSEQRVAQGKTFRMQLVPVEWIELERHTDQFLSFVRVITRLATNPEEPPAAPDCERCRAAGIKTAPSRLRPIS